MDLEFNQRRPGGGVTVHPPQQANRNEETAGLGLVRIVSVFGLEFKPDREKLHRLGATRNNRRSGSLAGAKVAGIIGLTRSGVELLHRPRRLFRPSGRAGPIRRAGGAYQKQRTNSDDNPPESARQCQFSR